MQETDHAIAVKMWAARALSYVSAALGIGTFMGLVNTLIGVMSACWLALQIYGYVRYEIPLKRFKRERALQAERACREGRGTGGES